MHKTNFNHKRKTSQMHKLPYEYVCTLIEIQPKQNCLFVLHPNRKLLQLIYTRNYLISITGSIRIKSKESLYYFGHLNLLGTRKVHGVGSDRGIYLYIRASDTFRPCRHIMVFPRFHVGQMCVLCVFSVRRRRQAGTGSHAYRKAYYMILARAGDR